MSYTERMQKAVDNVEKELQTIRTGRANPAILDRIQVEYYGSLTPLKSLVNITVPEGRTLQINPFDKSSLPVIEKSIIDSDLGFNPSNDGNTIRITIPELTKERRQELVKQMKKLLEDGKVSIRNIRRDELNDIKKDKELTEDDIKAANDEVQKTTDKFVGLIDTLGKAKEDELLKI